MKRQEVISRFKEAGATFSPCETKISCNGRKAGFPTYKDIDRVMISRIEKVVGLPKGCVLSNG